jgi:exonuclease SbcD
MKILHTSDWHLGKRLENFTRLEEQKQVLQEICEIADNENADAVIIAGDLFDTFNPPTEAVDLFYKTLKKLSNEGKRAVVAIAGNHDSPDRIEAPDPLARECGIILAGYPNSTIVPFELETGLKITVSDKGFLEIKLPLYQYPMRLLINPYANEYRLKTFLGINDTEDELRKVLGDMWKNLSEKHMDDKGVNILLTHLYLMKKGGEMPEEPDDEKPILHVGGAQAIYTENIPPGIQYTALGHLHRKQIVDENICPAVYSGSPLSYSFSEAEQQKYVIILNAEPGKPVEYNPVKLTKGKRLVRKHFDEIEIAINWLSENSDTFVELTIVTDKYLTSQERRQLNNVHKKIVSIIPEVRDKSILEGHNANSIDLSQDVETLFKDYFMHKHGQEPNERLLELFKETLAEEPVE